MRFFVDIQNFGDFADPRLVADLARQVEEAGWDGLSVWDHILVADGWEVADPWILLAAAATSTERITLATMVTPLPRRHPWKLAREAVTLDHLSGGRFVLGVGSGWPPEPEYGTFDGPVDLSTRAAMLDEGLDILTGMWTGEPFEYEGVHYRITAPTRFRPVPLQQPRIPIWVAAWWPNRAPVRRAAGYDGVAPIRMDDDGNGEELTVSDVRDIVELVGSSRPPGEPFDIVLGGMTPDDPEPAAERLAPLAEAGATWWRETYAPWVSGTVDVWRRRLDEGPPRW